MVASIAQPILGYVADRWRVPWFIPVGFTVTLVSISAMALATKYEMILALSLLAGVGAALFHPEAALLVNRTQSHEIGNAMGRFAVGGSAGFALGPLIAGGVYVFGGQFLWVFTAIAALGVLLYLYAFTGHTTEAEDARECESQIKGTNTGIKRLGDVLQSYFSSLPLDQFCSPYYPFLFQFCTLLLSMAKLVHLVWHLLCTLRWAQFSPIWVVHYQIS